VDPHLVLRNHLEIIQKYRTSHAKVAPSVLVNNFKTVSSRLIRKEFATQVDRVYRKPVFWSRSYCVVSCGGAPLSVLKQYVEGQAGVEDGAA
jgi:putative transposase